MAFKTASYTHFQNEKIIPNLDGLRGLSIFLVMFHHIPVVEAPLLRTLQINGRLGVMLFFAISGFLITQLGLKERRQTGSFNLKDFYIRRSLRIFPLYYAVMAAVCFLVYVIGVYPPEVKAVFTERLPSYLFYYSNFLEPIKGPFSLLWSLAVEEQFYLFFALVFYFLPVPWSRALFFALTLLRLSMPFWGPYAGDHYILTAFRYQEAIFLGVSLAYCLENPRIFGWLASFLGNLYSLTIVGLSIGACLLGFSSEEKTWVEGTLNVLFGLLVGSCALVPSVPFLGGYFLSHIGKISYGLYLFHTIVFYGVKRYISTDSWIVFCLGVPLTIFIGTISYRYFETYFLKMKKRFNP